jgi:hypothetical protein
MNMCDNNDESMMMMMRLMIVMIVVGSSPLLHAVLVLCELNVIVLMMIRVEIELHIAY